MLTQLRIRNFKAWKDTGQVRLAPITVFFGSNSSGKSSLLQFLLMLKQTAESPDRRRVLHPGDFNTPVELGTYRDLVFEHDIGNRISFGVEWTLPDAIRVGDPLSQTTYRGDRMLFEVDIAAEPKTAEPYVQSLCYKLHNHDEPLTVAMKPLESGARRQYELTATGYRLVRRQGRVWKLGLPIRFYGFPDEVGAYYQNADFTSDLVLSLEQELKRVQYLGPLREDPERSYTWSGEVPDHVGWRGERAVEAMLAASDRRIGPGYKKKVKPFQEVIASWLQELGLLESFEVRSIAQHRKEYEVVVRTKGSNKTVNLPDVGFGVSQVVPVVVECFYAHPHTTVLLEQPEIHLHPRVQTKLADLFIEAVKSREDGADRAIQLIVESHSEHFLRRLQLRVAEQKLDPADVALYFCEAGTEGATLRPLDLDLFGDIKNWPDDFFGDEMGEMAARLEAAARREKTLK